MKIHVSDISSLCFPEDVNISRDDSEMRANIKARVRENIGETKSVHTGRTLRTVLIVAAVATILTTAAFAISMYSLKSELTQDAVSGHRIELDENGNTLNSQKIDYPDAGMVLSVEGPQEEYNVPQFRCFWLPSEPTAGVTDSDGWSSYLGNMGEGASIPYVISASNVNFGNTRYVLNGDVEVISEEYINNWYILQLTTDYTGTGFVFENNRANYMILFDEVRGFLVKIEGTLDMEVLEHIADELEITESNIPQSERYNNYSEDIGYIDLRRG